MSRANENDESETRSISCSAFGCPAAVPIWAAISHSQHRRWCLGDGKCELGSSDVDMEFHCADGPSVHVRSSDAGQRLHRFASNAFREQLGRQGSSRLHSSCRGAALHQTFLVNGIVQPGRYVICAGDIVTMDASTTASDSVIKADELPDAAPTPQKRARMALSASYVADMRVKPLQQCQAFARYYTLQLPAAQWEELEAACSVPMPLCVRPNSSVKSAALVLGAMARRYGTSLRRVAWLPEAYFASSDADNQQEDQPLPADDTDALETEVADLLLRAQACGEVALQEAAAMLPTLALSPQPHHRVLDMCAAPGGKSLQLLDAMMTPQPSTEMLEEEDEAWAKRQLLPRGVLVSNDTQWQRQERTLRRANCQPCTPLVVTCGDATTLGCSCRPVSPALGSSDHGASSSSVSVPWCFDRVLCDVPCSGDGTMRKSPDVLTRWHVSHGLTVHPLQLRILRRGLDLLAIGGRLAYSTCSIDPLQNEAVVHAALSGRSDIRCGLRVTLTIRHLTCDPTRSLC